MPSKALACCSLDPSEWMDERLEAGQESLAGVPDSLLESVQLLCVPSHLNGLNGVLAAAAPQVVPLRFHLPDVGNDVVNVVCRFDFEEKLRAPEGVEKSRAMNLDELLPDVRLVVVARAPGRQFHLEGADGVPDFRGDVRDGLKRQLPPYVPNNNGCGSHEPRNADQPPDPLCACVHGRKLVEHQGCVASSGPLQTAPNNSRHHEAEPLLNGMGSSRSREGAHAWTDVLSGLKRVR